MLKTLVLLRHGDRDAEVLERDNGLSPKGLVQAERLAQFFRARFGGAFSEGKPPGVQIFCSPKLRCRQTVAPIGNGLGLAPTIEPNLDEDSIDSDPVRERAEAFKRKWHQGQSHLTIACSHGDLLPHLIYGLIGTSLEVHKGGWIEVEGGSGFARLSWFVPSFDALYR